MAGRGRGGGRYRSRVGKLEDTSRGVKELIGVVLDKTLRSMLLLGLIRVHELLASMYRSFRRDSTAMCSVHHMLCFFVFQFQRHGGRGVGQRTKIDMAPRHRKNRAV